MKQYILVLVFISTSVFGYDFAGNFPGLIGEFRININKSLNCFKNYNEDYNGDRFEVNADTLGNLMAYTSSGLEIFYAQHILRSKGVLYYGSCYSDGLRYRSQRDNFKNIRYSIVSKVSSRWFCSSKKEISERIKHEIKILEDGFIYTFYKSKGIKSNNFKIDRMCFLERL